MFVIFAQERFEIPFFVSDCDQYVSRKAACEHELADSHRWRRPEEHYPAEVQRVPDELVEEGHLELRVAVCLLYQVQPYLPQPEQIEVIDHERRQQDQQNSAEKNSPNRELPDLRFHRPDNARHRSPLPEQQDQNDARYQHVSTSLDGPWHQTGPVFLERRSRHNCVLHTEQQYQSDVDRQRHQAG